MAKKNSDILKFITPASWWGEKWRDGLLSGNGNIGANVYGGAVDGRVVINDSSLRWQGRVHIVPDVALKLKELRKKQDQSDFVGAQKMLPMALSSKRFSPSSDFPLPVGELLYKVAHQGLVSDYSRQLDMSSGEITTTYVANGTRFSTQLFVSRDSNIVVMQMTKQGPSAISAEFTFDNMHRVNSNTKDGSSPMPDNKTVVADKDMLYFAAVNDDGTDFGVAIRFINNGGTIKAENGIIKVNACNSLTLLLSTFTQGSRERDFAKLSKNLSAIRDNYDKLLRVHTNIHSKLYYSVKVKLTNEEDDYIENLVLKTNYGELPALLIEKLYKLGRYLFISGTSNNGKLFTPTGLWNGNYKAHRSAINFAGEMQMTYLHTLQGNLLGDIDKSFAQFEANLGDYQNNALRLFGCHGALVPAVNAPNTGRLGSDDIFAIYYTGSGAWLCNYYYRYARYSGNTKFLKSRLLPFMKEVALFYEDFFVQNGDSIDIVPSPLFMRLFDSSRIVDRPVVAKNSAIDYEVARHFFCNLINGCKETGSYTKDLPRWEKLLAKLPHSQLASDGTYKEFVNSSISVDYSGVSIGTLYPTFFGSSVNFLSDEEQLASYERTADKKLQEYSSQNSYYMSILASVYARLGNSLKAKQCISNCLRACATANLSFVDKDWRGMGLCGSGIWTPVQMQTNMVITNTVQQMLMFSKDNCISIMHCTSGDWKDVSVENMIADNGVDVSFETNSNKQTISVKLLSKKECTIDLYLPLEAKKFVKNSVYKLEKKGNNRVISQLRLVANKPVTLDLKYIV